MVENIKVETQSLQILNEQYGRTGETLDAAKVKAESFRIEQQLLSEAIRAGLAVTPALKEQIASLAQAYANAKLAAGDAAGSVDGFNKSAGSASESLNEFGDIAKGALRSFIDDVRSGTSVVDALENALRQVEDRLIDIALNSIFGGAQSGGIGGLGAAGSGIFGLGFLGLKDGW